MNGVRCTNDDQLIEYILKSEGLWDKFQMKHDQSSSGIIMLYGCEANNELWVIQSFKESGDDGLTLFGIKFSLIHTEPVQKFLKGIEELRGVSIASMTPLGWHVPGFPQN